MRVLVATRESQGSRRGDLWRSCIEGELVRPVEERCAHPPAEACSCETAFVGLVSRGLTTTAAVRDLPALTLDDYADALGGSLTRREARWILVDRYAEELGRAAGGLPGTGPVERRADWIGHRFGEDGDLRVDIAAVVDHGPRDSEDPAGAS